MQKNGLVSYFSLWNINIWNLSVNLCITRYSNIQKQQLKKLLWKLTRKFAKPWFWSCACCCAIIKSLPLKPATWSASGKTYSLLWALWLCLRSIISVADWFVSCPLACMYSPPAEFFLASTDFSRSPSSTRSLLLKCCCSWLLLKWFMTWVDARLTSMLLISGSMRCST